MAPTGEPRLGEKPESTGLERPVLFLVSTCIICVLFILYRRAAAVKTALNQRIHTGAWEGNIRLSEDDGPSSTEFLADNFDEDHDDLNNDNEPLAARAERIRTAGVRAAEATENPWGTTPRTHGQPLT